jgi:2-methylcitrate dehydratase PrpD
MHPANPLTAATLAMGEKCGSSGREMVLAWMVGWEIIRQTCKPCTAGGRNTLMDFGWFNQGFQSALGIAAACGVLMGFDERQVRLAFGNAATGMSGMMKNRASDSKGIVAGNGAMHGVMAAELVAAGFTANDHVLDGDDGVLRMLARDIGDPMTALDGLGTWDLALNGSTIKRYASCAAGHWAQDALQQALAARPTDPADIEAIEVHQPGFLMDSLPFDLPQTGLQGKYSVQYDVVAIALDGEAGMYQYTDEKVLRPEAQDLMQRVTVVPVEIDRARPQLAARVVVKLRNGDEFEETVAEHIGRPANPLSHEQLETKFHECAAQILDEGQRKTALDLCWGLETLEQVSVLADAVRADA